MRFYTSIFPDASMGTINRYGEGQEPEQAEHINYGEFTLMGQLFVAMESAQSHEFKFNEAVSLLVECQDQAEIDRYWEKLSAIPASEVCGWLKDKYGVSWQISPKRLDDMLAEGSPEQVARVTESFMAMKKMDLAELERVYVKDPAA
jgi:predicted 3-demethylubiquinone-9 3-methyltransferase (glyoxalase superfamily)